jgi:putative membrane protein
VGESIGGAREDEEMRTSERGRWPSWVYAAGVEPDYRFSLANERTFLAWIRTALALVAAGVAVDAFPLSASERLQTWLAVLLVLLGMTCAIASWFRWARAERAMRTRKPLPSSGLTAWLALGLVVVAAVLLAFGL